MKDFVCEWRRVPVYIDRDVNEKTIFIKPYLTFYTTTN